MARFQSSLYIAKIQIPTLKKEERFVPDVIFRRGRVAMFEQVHPKPVLFNVYVCARVSRVLLGQSFSNSSYTHSPVLRTEKGCEDETICTHTPSGLLNHA